MNFDAELKEKFLLGFLILISVALVWILLPYAGAFLWAIILAIVFQPMWRRILNLMPKFRALAALITVLLIIMLVIFPTLALISAVTQQVGEVVVGLQNMQWDPAATIEGARAHLPEWANDLVGKATEGREFDATNSDFVRSVLNGLQNVSGWLLAVGQGALWFLLQCGIALYLLFYFLMDDGEIVASVRSKGLFPDDVFDALTTQFAAVVRGTVMGGLLVAIIQGALGGLILWLLGFKTALLLAVLMTIGALIPAIGTGLVWVPVSIYLVITGEYGKAAILVGFCALIIGSIDNILRPILIGKSTKIPDFLVLATTLGGVDLMGPNGLIIGPMIAGLFLSAWGTIGQAPVVDHAEEEDQKKKPFLRRVLERRRSLKKRSAAPSDGAADEPAT